MARTINEDLTCDVCGSTSRVEPFTIVTPEGAHVVDLCPGDAKPLAKLWNAGSAQPRRKNPAKTHQPERHAVIPVD